MLGLALFAGGVATALWVGYRALTADLRLKARVRRTAATRIADLKDGQWAKISGRAVRAEVSLEAPLSHSQCLFAHSWIEIWTQERRVEGVPRMFWSDAGQEINTCDFWIEDDSGRVLIKLGGDFDPVPLFDPERYERFEDEGQRGQEITVCDGDTITAIGTVTRSAPEGGPFRSGGGPAVLISGTKSAPVILTM